MYITDSGRPPKKPVIGSQLSALREIERWMTENGFQELRDASGVPWQLSVQSREIPDEENPERMRWFVRLDLQAKLDAALLVHTGTLDAEKDGRLLGFLEDAQIVVRMRPLEFESSTPERAREELMERIPALKAQVRENLLHDMKRELVGRWVDRRGWFGMEIGE